MAAELTPLALELLRGKNFGAVATLMKDGSPQNTVIWVDTDGKHVAFNTAEGRVKTNNLRRDGRVAICVFNAENPYQQVYIRGRVVEMTREGADEHIDALAKKYMGVERYPYHSPDEPRVIVKVAPERVGHMG